MINAAGYAFGKTRPAAVGGCG